MPDLPYSFRLNPDYQDEREVKDFLDSNTLKQFENRLIDIISTEVNKGGINKDIKLNCSYFIYL